MGGLFRWKAYTGRQNRKSVDWTCPENRAQTDAHNEPYWQKSYYGLSLAKEVAAVRQDTYNGLKQHYEMLF